MALVKCPQCGVVLTREMLDANMCWECGKILDESQLDQETLNEISRQIEEQDPFCKPEIRNHKLTTGYNFDGYKIIDYVNLVSGEIVVGTDFLSDHGAKISDILGTKAELYTDVLKNAKKAALFDMVTESIKCGGDAVIGISYGYMVFSGNMIGVSVNGTSVKIENICKDAICE